MISELDWCDELQSGPKRPRVLFAMLFWTVLLVCALRGPTSQLSIWHLLRLADLGYYGFARFDWLAEHGYLWVSRLRGRTSSILKHTCYNQENASDQIVFLAKYRADRASRAVRLVM